MRDCDLAAFSEMLDAVCSLLSRGSYTPNGVNTALWFRALAAYDIDTVRAGFDAHVKDPQRGRFVPTPADVIAQIDGHAAADGRPGAEEAWATALRASDEAQTVVWTDEIAQAWGIAKPVFDGGDEVGARMAFKEAYLRLVDEARRARVAPAWSASLGHDPQLRDCALTAAARGGLLPAPDRIALPAPEESMRRLAGAAPPEVRERLLALRGRLTARADEPSRDLLNKQRTADLKRDAAELVASHDATDAA